MSRISKTDHLGRTTTSKVIRNPKCARCRNHGFVVQLKGHAGKCPLSHCQCWKCSLITERTKLMAIQRRVGKKLKDESKSSVSSRFKETPPQAGCSAEIIDVMNDPADMSVNDSGPHDSSTAGFRASVIQRTESVIKMPSARRFEADGKTYAELVPVRSFNAGTSKYSGSQEETAVWSPVHGSGRGGVESKREGMLYGVPPWSATLDHRAMPHFSGDYILTAVAQRDVYSSEVMTLPFPMKFYGHYPSSYGHPAILLNVPPTPAAPGPCDEPQMSFAGFVPSSVPCLPESRPAQDCQTAFFNPLPMSACSLHPQEDLTFLHPPYPTLHVHGGQDGGDHRLGN